MTVVGLWNRLLLCQTYFQSWMEGRGETGSGLISHHLYYVLVHDRASMKSEVHKVNTDLCMYGEGQFAKDI